MLQNYSVKEVITISYRFHQQTTNVSFKKANFILFFFITNLGANKEINICYTGKCLA